MTPPIAATKNPDTPIISPFRAAYAPDDRRLVSDLIAQTRLDDSTRLRIDTYARDLISHLRGQSGGLGGVEDFLREYSLSTREGLALMVLAEALLRVPDALTADRLIEDKLAEGRFDKHQSTSDTWLVSGATWALAMTSRIVQPGETPEGILSGLAKRIGLPTVREATRQAMRLLGYQFVLGQNIDDALSRAQSAEARGYRHSFDMLGEGARTMADAERYFDSYANAIDAIGAKAGDRPLPNRPGISVKLSALHPRYEAVQGDRVMSELVPRVLELARQAKQYDLNLTIDAEEADRLELSLDVIAAVFADPSMRGYDGFGLAVQAYQKRAPAVIDWIGELISAHSSRMMVRLVKGAYWDTEIKRAHERGLDGFPVFTRKPATDLCYLACAKKLLDLSDHLYPQFATHNAVTIAEVVALAGDNTDYEFQRLHGMGETLYDRVSEGDGLPCRIYAPVGGHRDLLAYLVRRLLENGANSSFVAAIGDDAVGVDDLLTTAADHLKGGHDVMHPAIALPGNLYAPRRANSAGLEFGHEADRTEYAQAVSAFSAPIKSEDEAAATRQIVAPMDGKTLVGTTIEHQPTDVAPMVARAQAATRAWQLSAPGDRAAILDRFADLLEAERHALTALLAMEAGKTLTDALAEIREAVDFCRYYAAEARRVLAAETILPGPTGEENRYSYRGRGVFACISPWNFPLAIFLGQVTAALVAGNGVIAKPAEQTPLIAARAAALLHQAGMPDDVLQLLIGDGKVGAALVAHPAIAGVAFTGSTQTAWVINRALAEKTGPIVPLIAETGGINTMIVDATALPEQVSDDVVLSAFRSAGQRCSALRLLYLQDDVADRMIEMIAGAAAELQMGDPRDPATDIGPVIDSEAANRLNTHIARMDEHAICHYRGDAPAGAFANGTWVAPHIYELERASELTEEVFGPILHVVRYSADQLDDVIDQIGATGYGLTLGVHSRIDTTIDRVVERLSVGNIYVNRNMIGAVVGTQPFGGSGLSGTGPKAGGPGYLPRFTHEQVVSINTAAAGGNASLMTIGD